MAPIILVYKHLFVVIRTTEQWSNLAKLEKEIEHLIFEYKVIVMLLIY